MTVVSNYTALLSGSTWYYGAPGQAVFLTYSFSQQATAYVQATNPTAAATFQPFTDAEKADARAALTQWSLISGITIVEVTQHEGDITFGNYDLSAMGLTGASGVGHYPVINVATGTQGALSYPIVGNQKQNPGGDVYIDNGVVGTGDDLHYLLLHETGHTLGLKHPFDGTVTLDPSLDNRTNTVMSYNGPPVETTPSPLDVQAIEYLYGTKATATTTVTLNWDAATESLTEQCSADAQFVRGENGDDTITATGSYDAVDAGQGNDVIYAAGKPIDVDGGPGDDTVHTGLKGRRISLLQAPAR